FTFCQVTFLWQCYQHCFCPFLWHFSLLPHCVTYVMYLFDQITSSCFYHFCCNFVCSWTLIHWHALHSFLHLFYKYIELSYLLLFTIILIKIYYTNSFRSIL